MKVLMSLLMALMFLGGQAVAEEGNICDGQIGAAFGLCTAYHSMGCDSSDPQASENACARLSARFEEITGYPMPTATPVDCPLWTAEDLDVTYGITYPCITCTDDDEYYNTADGVTIFQDTCDGGSGRDNDLSVGRFDDGTIAARYFDYGEEGQVRHELIMWITESQADACKADITSRTFNCNAD